MSDRPWWHGAVIYQIYPRSFADADGDGIGDLAGILRHLDHLRGAPGALGVDAIWLSPIFPSPNADYGYDISDYTDVAREFGSLEAFDELVTACHARGLRVLLDLVPNHTSIEHPWFVESRASRDNPRRNWYWWADPAPDGGRPNNWTSAFGGAAWLLDERTAQHYLHSFYPEQPDLNWHNPAVVDAIADVMRFWLRRGVDGFRVDAIDAVAKDPRLPDNPPQVRRPAPFPPDPAGQLRVWNRDGPQTTRFAQSLRRVIDEFDERLLIGEAYLPPERLLAYTGGEQQNGLQLLFDFELTLSEWDAGQFGWAIARGLAYEPPGQVPAWAFSNHDLARHGTRWGPDTMRLAALILLGLRGTICLYAGEEIGMLHPAQPANPPRDRAGRDAQRTPMQWDGSDRGGFTAGQPWLPLADPARANVADQAHDPDSLLSLYRRLIAVRSASPALRHGTLKMLQPASRAVLAWEREADGERMGVLANMSRTATSVDLRRMGSTAVVVAGTYPAERPPDRRLDLARADLQPLEGLIVSLSP